jgi:hypothetical protein
MYISSPGGAGIGVSTPLKTIPTLIGAGFGVMTNVNELVAYAGKRKVAPVIVSTRIERKNKTKIGVRFKFYEPNLSQLT